MMNLVGATDRALKRQLRIVRLRHPLRVPPFRMWNKFEVGIEMGKKGIG